MEGIGARSISGIEFTLRWRSSTASHTDCYFAGRVNFWRDLFRDDFREMLMGKREGDDVLLTADMRDSIPPYRTDNEFDIERRQFDTRYDHSVSGGPRFGRFYPKGILQGVANVFRGNLQPFRCVGVDEKNLRVDFNHPLSFQSGQLRARVHSVGIKSGDVGGSCTDWVEVVASGPGMQARWRGRETDFFSGSPFARPDETDDAVFYGFPRLVTHIDDEALSVLRRLYGTFLKDGMRVLDLISSWRSHVPDGVTLRSLIGLGLNAEEMKNNIQLSDFIVHDLNRDPRLPFQDKEFDAVLCTVSVEYMTQPFGIFEDVARVLAPGGIFIVTFSNRWFPPKAVTLWSHLHEFERMGLVLEYFMRSGRYRDLGTYSMRGRPRPFSDKHVIETQVSDPVYAVWGHAA